MSKKGGRIVPSPTRLPYLRMRGGAGSYILLAVLTTAQRDALTAETGMVIWNSTTTQVEEYNGSAWVAIPLAAGATITTPILASLYQAAGGGLISMPASVGADTVALLGANQTLTAKTLTSPVIQGTVGAGTGLTMPAFTLGGNIAMGGRLVTGLGAPALAGDALRKGTRVTAAELLDGTLGQVLTAQGAGIDPAYAAGGSGQNSLWGYIRAGDTYYGGQPGLALAITVALTANRLYALPFYVPVAITVDRIAVHVTTAADGLARLGIYQNGTNMYPGSLLLDAGTVDTSTTGIKAITISQALSAGFYWIVLVADATPTLAAINYAIPILGTNAASFNTGNDVYHSWYVAFTYAALPDPFPESGTIQGGTNYPPAILVRPA